MVKYTYCPYCKSPIDLRGINQVTPTKNGYYYVVNCECGSTGFAKVKVGDMEWERNLEDEDELKTEIVNDKYERNYQMEEENNGCI
jgi:hypothetical protein